MKIKSSTIIQHSLTLNNLASVSVSQIYHDLLANSRNCTLLAAWNALLFVLNVCLFVSKLILFSMVHLHAQPFVNNELSVCEYVVY